MERGRTVSTEGSGGAPVRESRRVVGRWAVTLLSVRRFSLLKPTAADSARPRSNSLGETHCVDADLPL